MVNLRRAIVWASAGQYLVIVVNFAALLVMARLLAPAEYGVAVLGGAILAIAEAIRELAGGSFLIRERELTPQKVRSMTTMSVIVTCAVAAVLVLVAKPLAGFFERPALTQYLWVSVLGYVLGPFIYAQMALFSRELQFNRLSVVVFLQALVGAGISILLALIGFSALSFAWASVASAMTGAALCLAVGRDLSIYRPSLSHWRSVVGFGAYSSATAILGRIGETLPVLIFGKFLSPDALAIGHRGVLLCLVPERIVQATVGPVALPEFSRRAREGKDLKEAYLTAVSHVSVVQWPAMIVLAILAEPVVLGVLGSQWLDVVPLLRILSPALMLSVPIGLQYATLVAVGAVDRLPLLLIAQTIAMIAALSITAPYGLHAAAWSMFVVIPVNAALSLMAVHNAIAFRWRDLFADAARCAFVCFTTAAGPGGDRAVRVLDADVPGSYRSCGAARRRRLASGLAHERSSVLERGAPGCRYGASLAPPSASARRPLIPVPDLRVARLQFWTCFPAVPAYSAGAGTRRNDVAANHSRINAFNRSRSSAGVNVWSQLAKYSSSSLPSNGTVGNASSNCSR